MPKNTLVEMKMVFENVESVTVKQKAVKYARFGDLRKDFMVMGNSMVHFFHPETFKVDFGHELFDEENLNLDNMHYSRMHQRDRALEEFKRHLFDYKDVTSLEVCNGLSEWITIIVPWKNEYGTSNEDFSFLETDFGYSMTVHTEKQADEEMKPAVIEYNLFRAKDELGRYVYGQPHTQTNMSGETKNYMVSEWTEEEVEKTPIVGDTIERFTGVYDIRGNEVYEGDTLKDENEALWHVTITDDTPHIHTFSGDGITKLTQQNLLQRQLKRLDLDVILQSMVIAREDV